MSLEILKEKGFDQSLLEKLESQLKATFDLRFLFNRWMLGEAFCRERLGVSEADLKDPNFGMLEFLGFSEHEIEEANCHALGTGTLEGAPYLKTEHYSVFDCANRSGKYGTRFLDHHTHIDMMAAAQPFISGAISKTINMPSTATIQEVQDAYYTAWKKMIKAISIYRDGSKLSQPLSAIQVAGLFSTKREHRKEERHAEPTPAEVGDPCTECGQSTMVRSGTCLRCLSCGATSGCS